MLGRHENVDGLSFLEVRNEIISLLSDLLNTNVETVSEKSPFLEISLKVAECNMSEDELSNELNTWLDNIDAFLEVDHLTLESE